LNPRVSYTCRTSSIGLIYALQVFNISVPTYRQWGLETFTSCFHSMVNRCNRIYPTQLSGPEIDKLKEKILSSQFQYWPISSIAFDSLRNGTLPLSLNTWYKYAKRLWISRPRSEDRRKKRVEGIRANRLTRYGMLILQDSLQQTIKHTSFI